MLPTKSTNNINNSTMLDTGSSSGPQPLLSTSVQPPSNFTTNNANKQRRPKMESSNPNKPSHNSNKSGSLQGGGHHQGRQLQALLPERGTLPVQTPRPHLGQLTQRQTLVQADLPHRQSRFTLSLQQQPHQTRSKPLPRKDPEDFYDFARK